MGKNTTLVVAILITILWIGAVGGAIFVHWNVTKDTIAWLDRAQVASNPEDMQDYLIKSKNGMDKWDLTDGYAAIIWRTPQNYMPLVVEALDRSIERCEYMKEFTRTSIEYQVALDDVRGQLRELDLHTPYSWWVNHLVFLFWIWFGWLPTAISWCCVAADRDWV